MNYPIPEGKNGEIINRYLKDGRIRGLSNNTIDNKAWRLHVFLKFLDNKDLRAVTREDVGDYILFQRDRGSSATVKGDAIELYGILQVAPARGGHGAQGPAPETNIPRRPHPG